MTVTSERPTRRDRRKRELRQRIYEAARALFIAQGFEKTTLDEIAERADVARATVCNHFPKKTAFLREWADLRRDEVRAVIRRGQQDGESLHDQVLKCFELLAELNRQDQQATRVFCTAWMSTGHQLTEEPVLAMIFADLARHAERAGELPADTSPEDVGYLLGAVYFDVLGRWVMNPAGVDLPATLRRTVRLALHGVLPR